MRYADTLEDAEFRSAANAWLSQNVPLREKDEFDNGIFFDYPTYDEIAASRADAPAPTSVPSMPNRASCAPTTAHVTTTKSVTARRRP